MAVEEGLAAEDHPRKHSPERPEVQAVVVVLEVDEQLRPLKVAGGDADVVLLARVVELGQACFWEWLEMEFGRERRKRKRKVSLFLLFSFGVFFSSKTSHPSSLQVFQLTPVDQPQLLLDRVDHHVVRLDVPVHHPSRVAEIQRFQQFIDVEADVGVRQRRIEHFKVGSGDVLKDQGRRLGGGVAHAVQQRNHVGPTAQVLQNLDLALDLLLLDGFQDLDNAALARRGVDPLEDLRVLAAADLAHDLVVVLGAVRAFGGVAFFFLDGEGEEERRLRFRRSEEK